MVEPGRKYVKGSSKYRYGFNGKENDNSTGEGNVDFGARVYDGRLGRWLSVDPLQKKYPSETPYLFAGASPIAAIDVDGKYKYVVNANYDAKTGKITIISITVERGLKAVTKYTSKQTCSDCGSILIDVTDWHDYRTFNVTVTNDNGKAPYQMKLSDQILDKKTTTEYGETYAKIKTGEFGNDVKSGIVFTSYNNGEGWIDTKRTGEFMTNIYGLQAAIAGLAAGGPAAPEAIRIKGDIGQSIENAVSILPDAVQKSEAVVEMVNEVRKNFGTQKSSSQIKTTATKGKESKPKPDSIFVWRHDGDSATGTMNMRKEANPQAKKKGGN
jgi:RHS repeat-associated protein